MVEWKKLGEICTNLDFKRKPITSAKRVAGIYPYYGASGIVDYVENYIFDGDYLLVSEDGANLLARTSPIAFSIKGKNWVNNHAHVLEFKYTTTQKFVEVYLNMIDLSPWINGAAQPKLNQANLSIIDIPFPPLSEQNRIVGILDTFTDSIENLKQQIAQRRKQYEFYRDQLLDLEGKEGVEMKTLGESSILISDGDHQPPPKSQQGIPFITISNINKDNHKIDFSNTYYVPSDYYESLKNERKAIEGDVLYTVTGSYGIPVIIDFTDKFCFQRHIAMIRPNIKVLISKFLYHCLLTRGLKKQADEYASGGAQKTVSLSSLRKFVIPVLPLSEQKRIVSILDTFEASISNLEAQLAQRQKQYEYYRNKLLTFE